MVRADSLKDKSSMSPYVKLRSVYIVYAYSSVCGGTTSDGAARQPGVSVAVVDKATIRDSY